MKKLLSILTISGALFIACEKEVDNNNNNSNNGNNNSGGTDTTSTGGIDTTDTGGGTGNIITNSNKQIKTFQVIKNK